MMDSFDDEMFLITNVIRLIKTIHIKIAFLLNKISTHINQTNSKSRSPTPS